MCVWGMLSQSAACLRPRPPPRHRSAVRKGGVVDPQDLALGLTHWRYFGSAAVGHGRPEDGNIGLTDWLALSHGLFISDSQFASDCVLQEFGDQTGGNKVLWRTILLGCISGADVEV